MTLEQKKRKYDAPPVGTRYGKLVVTEDNDVYLKVSEDSKYTKRCVVLACDCGGTLTVSHSNLRWANYRSCTKCPYECKYCGNTDITLKYGDSIARCKRCAPAFRHNVPWDLYKSWLEVGCAICGSKKNPHIDHDHTCCSPVGSNPTSCGKCVRGLLCGTHNQLIGYYENGWFDGIKEYLN